MYGDILTDEQVRDLFKSDEEQSDLRVFNDNQYEIVFYLIIMFFYCLITFHVVDYTRFSCFVFVKIHSLFNHEKK